MKKYKLLLITLVLLAVCVSGFSFSMGYHFMLIRDIMLRHGLSIDAYSAALSANGYTDIFQVEETEWLIDDDFCQESKKLVENLHFDQLNSFERIDAYYRQLIKNTREALEVNIANGDTLGILMNIGVSLHIIEDFYAHSNWSELDFPRLTGIDDATYFDVVVNYREILDLALENEKDSFLPYAKPRDEFGNPYSWGLYTNGSSKVQSPKHDEINKDNNSRPFFDWAFRAAFKATWQWLELMKYWVEDISPGYWSNIKNYVYSGNTTNLHRLASFDWGTIRWTCIFGGAWTKPGSWSWNDALMQDIPNVPGFGFFSQASQDYPFLGVTWFEHCYQISKNLFEAQDMNKFERVSGIDNFQDGLDGDKDDFAETVSVQSEDFFTLPDLENNSVCNDAYTYMANVITNTYQGVNWIKLEYPKLKDADDGDGLFNINNEEPFGDSDYWIMVTINGVQYSEAEYIDIGSKTIDTDWGELIPVWNNDPIDVSIRMYESDPTNDKDESMDIHQGSGDTATFTVYPNDSRLDDPVGYYFECTDTGNKDWAAILGVRVRWSPKTIPFYMSLTYTEVDYSDPEPTEDVDVSFKTNINSQDYSSSAVINKSKDQIYPNVGCTYMPWFEEREMDINMDVKLSPGNRLLLDILYNRDNNQITGDVTGKGGEYIKVHYTDGSSFEFIINTSNRPPIAELNGPYVGQEVATFHFDTTGTHDPDGDPLKYRWDFNGNGTWDTGWSTSPDASYTWLDDYEGTVYMQVTDGLYEVTASASVYVANVAPNAYAGTNQEIVEGDIVYFNGSFTDPGVLDTHTIVWDFGDGQTAVNTLTPSHLFTSIGTFIVTLTVTDDDGGVGTSTMKVDVKLAAIHAEEELVISDASVVTVPVKIVSNGYTQFKADVVVNTNVAINDNIFMCSRATINGDLTVEGTIEKQDNVVINGTETTGTTSVILSIPTKIVPYGSANITANNDTTVTWTPGNYRDGMIRARSTVTMTAGDYNFYALNIEPSTTIIFDLSRGDININTETAFEIGDRAQFIASGDNNLNFYSNSTGTVRVGTDFAAHGSLVVPHGTIHVYSRTESLRVAAKKVYIEPRVVFYYEEK